MEPSRGKRLWVPCARAEPSAACVAAPARCRQPLPAVSGPPPERVPPSRRAGCGRHDQRGARTPQGRRRRLARTATAVVCLGRPAGLWPAMGGRPAAGAQARARRPWGGPCDAVGDVCGRAALDGERAALAGGRPPIVGRPGQQPAPRPAPVRADAQPPWALGPAGEGATTGGGGSSLGAPGTAAAAADALAAAYGAWAQAAPALSPPSSPQPGGPDGWEGPPRAWRRLGPTGGLRRCCLHAGLQSAERWGRARARRQRVLARVGAVEAACPRVQGSQRRRRRRAWATAGRPAGALRQRVLTRCDTGPPGARASRCPGPHRPANAFERLRNPQARRRAARRARHGTPAPARLARRALAGPWHCPPDRARTRRAAPTRRAPFHALHGVASHPTWLHNLRIASSMGGRKRCTTKSDGIRHSKRWRPPGASPTPRRAAGSAPCWQQAGPRMSGATGHA
jgi:hypothetical protein